MNSTDTLNYSLSFFLIVSTFGIIAVTGVLVSLMLAVKEMIEKAKEVARTAQEIELRAKKGIMYFALKVLDFISERR